MNKRILATVIALGVAGVAALTLAQQAVTLRVVGFEVSAAERGTPLDQAYKKFLADSQRAIPGLTIQSLETPPDFDTQLLVDLAAGTGPDVWSQDASTLARLVDSGNVLDMRRCQAVVPSLTLGRFFPSVLAIHRRADGAIYGLPNDFTPMMIYYNPEAFARAKVAVPRAGWTWDNFLRTAQLMTIDKNGRNRLDANFDENNVVQWGFRQRKFPFEWVYRLWQNGGDVLSPDGKTATGFLDSPASLEAIQFMADLVLKYKVAPRPSTLDQLTQQLGFLDRFLRGDFAMFDRGHWELVGLLSNKEYKPGRIGVAPQPRKRNGATVMYASGWVINKAVERDPRKLEAACRFVERATNRVYQDTKAITGIAIAANQLSAAAAIRSSKLPEVERAFFNAVPSARAPYGSKFAAYPAVETILESMMDRILNGAAVEATVKAAVAEINREVSR
jgi:multiple sugar transport system substrate-binding protein